MTPDLYEPKQCRFFFFFGPHQYVKHQLLTVLSCSVVPLQWVWHLSSPTTQLSTDSEHYCATQFLIFSSLTSSDKLYLSLSHSVLPLLISQFSPGAPEVYKCSSASLQYELISNLAARRSEGKIDTKTHSLQKQVEECRTKYSYHKNIYKDHVTGSKHRVALFCWNKKLLIITFPNLRTTL